MNRQTLLWTLVCMVVVVGAYFVRQKKLQARIHLEDSGQVQPIIDVSDDQRVYFVCCTDHGVYSPVVYARCGGGMAAFETILRAAPFMRDGDPGTSAAGLCGFLFKDLGFQGHTAGLLQLDPAPDKGADGTVHWENVGADGDVFVINLDTASARCCSGSVLGYEIHDLPLGGRATKPR